MCNSNLINMHSPLLLIPSSLPRFLYLFTTLPLFYPFHCSSLHHTTIPSPLSFFPCLVSPFFLFFIPSLSYLYSLHHTFTFSPFLPCFLSLFSTLPPYPSILPFHYSLPQLHPAVLPGDVPHSAQPAHFHQGRHHDHQDAHHQHEHLQDVRIHHRPHTALGR